MTDAEPLRARNRRAARDHAVDATAALVREAGTASFTMAEVAERAGMSLRTLYRHFPTRQDLIDALAHVADQAVEPATLPRTVDDVGPWLARAWWNLLDDEALVRAQHDGPNGAAVRRSRAQRHRAVTVDIVREIRPDLAGAELDDVVTAAMLLTSSTALFEFIDVLGIDVEHAADVAAEAIRALLTAR